MKRGITLISRKYRSLLGYVVFFAFLVLLYMVTENNNGDIIKKENPNFKILYENKEISALCVKDEKIWVGMNDGVSILDADSLEEYYYIDGIRLVYSAGMAMSKDGIMWIGHEDGVTGIDENGSRIDFGWPNIPKGRVNTVEYDGEKVWIGTYNGAALLSIIDGKWRVENILDREDGLASDSVNVIRTKENEIWIGSYLDVEHGGISILENDSVHQLKKEDGLLHPYVTSIQVLDSQNVLVGCGYMDSGGLVLIQQDKTNFYVARTWKKENGLPGDKVRYLYKDQQGYVWITTEYDGVLVMNQGPSIAEEYLSGLYYTENEGLSDNEIKCIVESENHYWLGGKYGLTIIPKEFIINEFKN